MWGAALQMSRLEYLLKDLFSDVNSFPDFHRTKLTHHHIPWDYSPLASGTSGRTSRSIVIYFLGEPSLPRQRRSASRRVRMFTERDTVEGDTVVHATAELSLD